MTLTTEGRKIDKRGSGLNRVVVDWDGTCVENAWPAMGNWLPGAKGGIRSLLNMGLEVVIFSTRLSSHEVDEVTPRPEEQYREYLAVRDMLDEAGLYEVGIWMEDWKPGALFYLDDKAVHIETESSLASWAMAVSMIGDSVFAPTGENVASAPIGEEPAWLPIVGEERRIEDHGPSDPVPDAQPIREFKTGATRNRDDEALDFEGFLSSIALRRFAEYMHEHRRQPDGSVRDSDNWQKGIPDESYVKSLLRHVFDVWLDHRGFEGRTDLEDALCAVIFNAQGLLHETVKARLNKED